MSTLSSTPYDAAVEYARKRGADDGRNAAGWYIQDTIGGRVAGDPVKAAAYILRGIDDGDSAVTDGFPYADLSGEWADTLTGPQLVDDALSAAGVAVDDETTGDASAERMDWFTDVCDAYETAFSDACTAAIETAAREILA